MTTTVLPRAVVAREARALGSTIAWPLVATIFASACIVVGLIWDISWHRTVGRDTFWTYPHVLEQLAAVIAGGGCGWLVLRTTFAGTAETCARTVRVWGFRGPLGAWVCIWGTITMIASAPFDDWWHNAYGLDVRVISPPHMVLAAGMIAIQLGAMLMAVAAQNRADEDRRRALGIAYAIAAGILVTMAATVLIERAGFANLMHGSAFYKITGAAFPLLLVASARASRLRWPATTAAGIYMGIVLISMWTLQLFPATPKLAPIYNPVTHMVPPPFPLLLMVPAVFIDAVLQRGHGTGGARGGVRRGDWGLAVILGLGFVAIFLVVQWFFADFLLSPAARQFLFGGGEWDYNVRPGAWQHEFWSIDRDALGVPSSLLLARGLLVAALMAVISARLGLWWGNGMGRVRR
jgi:hypothetical protein